ncbi:MmpS family transport accessory protein [Streptacidiphilus sp. N1-10]|uniref:MmpS family transport accessory protein n=1 Tax=Streptacidiphilus jeojiensis TaxID=3229225 RepID=A0ABV6XG61_9ACTN
MSTTKEHAEAESADATAPAGGMSARGRQVFERVPDGLFLLAGLLALFEVILLIAWGIQLGQGPAPARTVVIEYVVTGTGSTANLSVDTPTGSAHHADAALPFRASFTFKRGESVSVDATAGEDGEATAITCTLLADGVVVKQSTATGAYAGTYCLGTAGEEKPLPGATVPAGATARASGSAPASPAPSATGNTVSRLSGVVRLPAHPGKGSPVKGRVTDSDAHLSYDEFGGRWNASEASDPSWDGFDREQDFDTEKAWSAQIASGLVDSDLLDDYTATEAGLHAAASAVQDQFQKYNFVDDATDGRDVASQPLTVSGHKAWLVAREMRFTKKGVQATMDLSVVVVVDTGRPRPSVLWIDLPATVRTLWPDTNTLVSSLRVTP